MTKNKYKFVAHFPCKASIISEKSYTEIYKNKSSASLDTLKSLLPERADVNKNLDLLYLFFNGAVANQFNLNGDGVDGNTAIAYSKYFIDKRIDMEHDVQSIAGHVISYGFASYTDENKIFSVEELQNFIDPFNISFCGVLYRDSNEDLAEAIEECDDKLSPNYHKISASWEVGYNDFVIAKGFSRNLKDCRIISDAKEMIQYMPYCKGWGGDGMTPSGEFVFRLLTGEIYPLGFGITTNPAADVKGITIINNDPSEYEEEEEDSKLNKENISHTSKNNVNNLETKNNMTISEQIQQIVASATEKKIGDKEVVASLTEILSKELEKANKDYVEKIESEKKEKEDAKASREKIEKDLSETAQKLVSLSKEIESLKQEKVSKAAEDIFNARMEILDKEYDLDEKDHKVIASDLKDMDTSDEAFEAYQEKFSIFFSSKSKAQKQKIEKEIQDKIEAGIAERVKATILPKEEVKINVETIIEKVKASKEDIAAIPNAQDSRDKSLFDKFSEAFNQKTVKIKL